MTTLTEFLTLSTAPEASSHLSVGWPASLRTRIVTWVTACADRYAATASYDQLSRLSGAELAHRGIARANLHRWCFEDVTRPTVRTSSSIDRLRM